MDLFSLVGRISLDKSGFDSGIREANRQGENLGKKMQKWLGTSAKVLTGTMAAASAGMVKLARDSLNAYSKYEQLKGGVETIFGDDAAKVLKNAQTAYKDAGVSMNQYMELTMEGSAALIKSLRGDTALAAQYSDMSIKDMSDNVNKMGTSIEAVQNAYRGFSRGNFTMLDNLKLGYAGTKQGMKDLLKDAEAIQKKHGKTVKYSIDSYADIIDAIHVIQDEMGITGTTAEEADGTIEGSLKSAKAAFQDFLVALATGEKSDISRTTKAMVERFHLAAQNIGKRLGYIATGLSEAMKALAPIIRSDLPGIIKDITPSIISGAGTLVASLIAALPGVLQALKDTLPGALQEIANAAIDAMNEIFGTNLPHIEEFRWPTWPEVKGAFLTAWGAIQQEATKLLKLAFGTTEDGGIAWPSPAVLWSKVKSKLSEVWAFVVQQANNVLKLAFGTTEDGGIAWPSPAVLWHKAKSKLEEIWGYVLEQAKGVLKLVFGTTEDGGIAWPSPAVLWHKAKAKLEEIWGYVLEQAKGVLKLAFGTTEDGGIDWGNAETIWNNTKAKAGEVLATVAGEAEKLLKLVFGTTEDGGINWGSAEDLWNKVSAKAGEVFGYISEQASGLLKLVFGTNEDGSIQWPNPARVLKSAGEWWRGNILPVLSKGISLVAKLFKVDISPETVETEVNKWWSGVESVAQSIAHMTVKLFSGEDLDTSDFGVVESALTIIKSLAEWAIEHKEEIISIGAGIITAEVASRIMDIIKALQNFSMTGNPTLLAIGAIATLITEIALHWDDITEALKKWRDAFNEYIIKPIQDWYENSHLKKVLDAIWDFVAPKNLKEASKELKQDEKTFEEARAFFEGLTPEEKASERLAKMAEIWDKLSKSGVPEWWNGDLTSDQLTGSDTENIFAFVEAYEELTSGEGKVTIDTSEAADNANNATQAANGFKATLDAINGMHVSAYIDLFTGDEHTATGGGFYNPNIAVPKASGQNYVPYDNYLASLHRGEAVLNASQARDWRSGGGGGYGIDSAALEAAVASAVASAVGNIQINMDGESVGHAVAGTVDSDIGALADSARYT